MANAMVKYIGEMKNNSWARWMNGRVHKQNSSNLVSVVGKTGSGKTYSAISICEIMSKMDGIPFTIEHIVFSLRELMDLINSGKLERGSKIIFDEPQVSISARDFQSEANKVFNFLVSTFRHRNLTLFFCTPFETLLDKNTRRLFHARFETISIDRNKKTCRLKPRFLEFADFRDEPYRKQLIIFYKDKNKIDRTQKLFYWDVIKPSEELIKQYEAKKLEFTTNLNLNISQRLKKFDDSGKSITAKYKTELEQRKPLTEKQERVMRLLANIKESNRYEIASKKLSVSLVSIGKNRKLAEKKGYTLEEFKENNELILK